MKKLEEKKELKRLCSRREPKGPVLLSLFRTRTLNCPHAQQMSSGFLAHNAKGSKALQSGSAEGSGQP
jgi:hypothetical protein